MDRERKAEGRFSLPLERERERVRALHGKKRKNENRYDTRNRTNRRAFLGREKRAGSTIDQMNPELLPERKDCPAKGSCNTQRAKHRTVSSRAGGRAATFGTSSAGSAALREPVAGTVENPGSRLTLWCYRSAIRALAPALSCCGAGQPATLSWTARLCGFSAWSDLNSHQPTSIALNSAWKKKLWFVLR